MRLLRKLPEITFAVLLFVVLTALPKGQLLHSFVFPSQVHAQFTQAWSGVCTNDGTADGVATIQGIQCVLANILSIAVSGIGLAGFVMLIIGAFKMLLGGNAKGIEDGRNTITLAVIGLVVALSAWVIINLIAAFTGVNAIKTFTLPNSNTTFGP